MVKVQDGTPNAAKFVEQVLREGMSYTFASAVADIVDNALSAKATEVDIQVKLDGSQVAVLDNGKGMDLATHSEAMKVASITREYEAEDLGKYGTGMKSASLSQAARVIVATSDKPGNQPTILALDLDHIRKTNDFGKLVLVLETSAIEEIFCRKLTEGTGTVVIWQNLDRAFGKNSLSSASRANVVNELEKLDQHIAMVFHRFLDGSIPNRKSRISIRINGTEVKPWDPFVRSESTKILEDKDIPINGTKIHITGYVLPGEKEFSSKKAFGEASGPKRWIEGQGFYVYRNYRLIRWGGWLKMRGIDSHLSLARISLEIPSKLDPIFDINVAKSRVVLPAQVQALLASTVTSITAQANARYRSQKKIAQFNPGSLPTRDTAGQPSHVRKMSAQTFAGIVERIAAAEGLNPELEKIKKAILDNSPQIAEEVGW